MVVVVKSVEDTAIKKYHDFFAFKKETLDYHMDGSEEFRGRAKKEYLELNFSQFSLGDDLAFVEEGGKEEENGEEVSSKATEDKKFEEIR